MSAADHTICEICGAAATIQLADTERATEHLYCSDHEPDVPIGQRKPRLVITRFRLPPGNCCSQHLAAPKSSPEHTMFRKEMCDDQLLGGDGACRYYLSIVSGTDQFAVWDDQFVQNVKDYIISQTCDPASQFIDDLHSVQFLDGFLRRAYERFENPDKERRITKQERAVELLLHHPDWSDEQIASTVPTTIKQLQRFTDFTGLRAVPKRKKNAT